MIKRFASLLRRIVRFQKMLDILISLYSVYIPLGFIFLLLALGASDEGNGLVWEYVFVGIIFITFGIVAIVLALERARTKEGEDEKRFKKLIAEIKRLGKALRAKKDGE